MKLNKAGDLDDTTTEMIKFLNEKVKQELLNIINIPKGIEE